MQAMVRKERWPGGYKGRGVPLVGFGADVLPDQPVLRLPQRSSGALRNDELISAGLSGSVVGITARGGIVIESQAAVVHGTLGTGRQVAGVLTLWPEGEPLTERLAPPGAILIVRGCLTFQHLRSALDSGAMGIVAASITLRDLEGFLRTDLLQMLTNLDLEAALPHLPSLTLMLTEGIGVRKMPEATFRLLNDKQGASALLSGLTSVRWGVRPDLVISLR
jgi:hypothetical protein